MNVDLLIDSLATQRTTDKINSFRVDYQSATPAEFDTKTTSVNNAALHSEDTVTEMNASNKADLFPGFQQLLQRMQVNLDKTSVDQNTMEDFQPERIISSVIDWSRSGSAEQILSADSLTTPNSVRDKKDLSQDTDSLNNVQNIEDNLHDATVSLVDTSVLMASTLSNNLTMKPLEPRNFTEPSATHETAEVSQKQESLKSIRQEQLVTNDLTPATFTPRSANTEVNTTNQTATAPSIPTDKTPNQSASVETIIAKADNAGKVLNKREPLANQTASSQNDFLVNDDVQNRLPIDFGKISVENESTAPIISETLSINPLNASKVANTQEDVPVHQTIFQNLTEFVSDRIGLLTNSPAKNKPFFSDFASVTNQNTMTTAQEAKATLLDIQRNISENNANYSIDGYSAKLRIHPPELGQINAEITVNKGQAELRLFIENNEVKHVIETHLHQLRDSFQESSVNLTQVNVQTAPEQDQRSFREDFNHRQSALEPQSPNSNEAPMKERQSTDSLIDVYA